MLKILLSALLAPVAALLGTSIAYALPAYTIVSHDGTGANVRVSVRLDARQTQADLKAIADAVKTRLPKDKLVARVAFYLPAMALNAQPWAELQTDADRNAVIHGLRLEEETAYRSELAGDARQLVGAWLTSPPALAGRLVLYKQRGKVFAEWLLRNGQKTTDEVYEQRTRAGRRFEIAGGDGGYYLLGGDGNLVLGSGATVIAVADPIQPWPASSAKAMKAPVADSPAAGAAAPGAAYPAHPQTADKDSVPTVAAEPSVDKVPVADVDLPKAPTRKRASASRPSKAQTRPTRQADAAGDAITRALAR